MDARPPADGIHILDGGHFLLETHARAAAGSSGASSRAALRGTAERLSLLRRSRSALARTSSAPSKRFAPRPAGLHLRGVCSHVENACRRGEGSSKDLRSRFQQAIAGEKVQWGAVARLNTESGVRRSLRFPRASGCAGPGADEPKIDLLAEQDPAATEGKIAPGWDRITVQTRSDRGSRFFELEPGDEPSKVEFQGFYVRGVFGSPARTARFRREEKFDAPPDPILKLEQARKRCSAIRFASPSPSRTPSPPWTRPGSDASD